MSLLVKHSSAVEQHTSRGRGVGKRIAADVLMALKICTLVTVEVEDERHPESGELMKTMVLPAKMPGMMSGSDLPESLPDRSRGSPPHLPAPDQIGGAAATLRYRIDKGAGRS